MFNITKSRSHTSDLQTKAFQGHYLKHEEIVEFLNISFIDTVHFVWYDYRDYMFNNIKSRPHTGDLQTEDFLSIKKCFVILQVPYVWGSDFEKPWFGGHWYEDVTW